MPIDPKQTKVEKELTADAPLICCRFDPAGRFVFAGAQDQAIYRFEIASGSKTVLAGHESWVGALAVTPDGATLVSAGYDDTLRWWPAAAEKPEASRVVKAHDGWIRAVAVSPDGSLVASGGNDRIVRLWKASDGSPVRELKAHERDIYSIAFAQNGTALLTGDLDGHIHHWEVATGAKVRTFEATALHMYEGGQQVHYGGIRGLAVSPDGQSVVAGGLTKATNPLGNVQEPLALRFAWTDAKLVKNHASEGLANHTLWGVAIHPDGFALGCVGGGSGHLLFWGPDDEKPVHKFDLGPSARGFDLHAPSGRVATIHADRKIKLVALGGQA